MGRCRDWQAFVEAPWHLSPRPTQFRLRDCWHPAGEKTTIARHTTKGVGRGNAIDSTLAQSLRLRATDVFHVAGNLPPVRPPIRHQSPARSAITHSAPRFKPPSTLQNPDPPSLTCWQSEITTPATCTSPGDYAFASGPAYPEALDRQHANHGQSQTQLRGRLRRMKSILLSLRVTAKSPGYSPHLAVHAGFDCIGQPLISPPPTLIKS